MPQESKVQSFIVFRCLWAVSMLIHFQWGRLFLGESTTSNDWRVLALTALAISILLFPRVAFLFFLSLLALPFDAYFDLPVISNHWLLASIVSLTFLLVLLFELTKGERTSLEERWYFTSRRVIQLEVCIFYAFTFIWKLNTDFLNPQLSCAAQFYQHTASWLYLLPTASEFTLPIIAGTLVLEAILPFFLFFPRFRNAAIGMALCFHFFLAADFIKQFSNFSALMFALLWLFVPANISDRTKIKAPLLWKHLDFLRITFATLYVGAILYSYVSPDDGFASYSYYRHAIWTFSATLFLAFYVRCVMGHSFSGEVRPIPKGFLLWIGPLLILLNGLSPILGLKTRSSWQMYSNLRLEADSSNHLFIPRSLDLFGFLRDDVLIIDSNDSTFTGKRFTLVSLQQLAIRKPDLHLSYERNAAVIEAHPLSADPNLMNPGFLRRKIAAFVPLGDDSAGSCLW